MNQVKGPSGLMGGKLRYCWSEKGRPLKVRGCWYERLDSSIGRARAYGAP
jgi:hypothetical protein